MDTAMAGPVGDLVDLALRVVPTGLVIADPTMHVLFANEQAEALFGPMALDIEEPGRSRRFLRPDGSPYRVEDLPMRRCAATGEAVVDQEIHLLEPGRRTVVISANARPLPGDHGELRAVVATFEDITERARAEWSLRVVAEAGRALAKSLDPDTTLGTLVRHAVPTLGDWCKAYVVDESGRVRRVGAAHADPSREPVLRRIVENAPPVSPDSPMGQALRTGQSSLLVDVGDDELDRFGPPELTALYRELGWRSSVAVPLVARGRVLGAIVIVGETPDRVGVEELEVARELAARAALAVDNAHLYQQRAEIARTLQHSLLPPLLPAIPGIELAARYVAAGEGVEVGGDFYDVFPTRNTSQASWGVVIGDVRGEGTDAATVVGLARYAIRTAAIGESRPSRILSVLNEVLLSREVELDPDGSAADPRFLTACYVRIRPNSTGVRCTISSAGHPLPFLCRADGSVAQVGRPGTLLGVLPHARLLDAVVELAPGDTLVLYTDGVIERHAGRRFFGDEELAAVLADSFGLDASMIARRVEAAVVEFAETPPTDDLALLVLQVRR